MIYIKSIVIVSSNNNKFLAISSCINKDLFNITKMRCVQVIPGITPQELHIFLNHRSMKNPTDKNKTPLSITTLNTYLINTLLIFSLLVKYFFCLFFSLLIKSFFPFSLQFLLCFYFLNFFLLEYHFPYTCFTKCSSKNIHCRSCKWH